MMITIDEAVETLTIEPGQESYYLTEQRRKALAIGIEALEAIKLERDIYAFERIGALPGETEEA